MPPETPPAPKPYIWQSAMCYGDAIRPYQWQMYLQTKRDGITHTVCVAGEAPTSTEAREAADAVASAVAEAMQRLLRGER